MEKVNYTIIFSILYILGIISFNMNFVIPCSIFLLLVVIICLYKNILTNKTALIFYLAFVIAVVNCGLQFKNFDDLSSFVSKEGKITGTVETIPTTNNSDKTKFFLKVQSYDFGDNQVSKNADARTMVTIYGNPESLSRIKIADTIELQGKLRNPMRATNPCQFDYGLYLKNHKTFSTFYSSEKSMKIISKPKSLSGLFLQKLSEKRNDILTIHKKYMKSPNLEVLGGIVFGDDAINPPEDIRTSFINSGLLHILAASGMNVSIIFGIWFFIGTRLRLNYRVVIFIGAVLVAFYTLMTGMGPSVLRASLMIEFVLLGKLINRNADSIALIFFVALLMLLYNPAMISDVGFQLSFVVTFALMFYCPPLLEKVENKVVEYILGGLLIPFVAQLFAAPIQMFYFNSFATYSIFANFVITPLIMIISFLGFLGSIFAMIPFIADKVCMAFDFVLNPVVTMLVDVSYYFSKLPHSLLTTSHPDYLQIVLYYSVLVMLGFAFRNRFWGKKFFVSLICLLVLFAGTFVKINNSLCEIIVFDVGNADSFLIKTPDKKYILIDTANGSLDSKNPSFSQAEAIMGKYFKDNGIKDIELLILTHFDSDHSGGAVDMMKLFNVKRVIICKEIDNSKTTSAILDYINSVNQNYSIVRNDDIVYESSGVTLKTYVADLKKAHSDNENSIVTLLSYGNFDMLFMADAGIKSFEKIKKYLPNTKIEILKSGHHGARDTVSKEMLNFIEPDVAIISTGLNVYGHPDKQTLKFLVEKGVSIFRTDVNRAMKITVDIDGYSIYSYNNDNKSFQKIFFKKQDELLQTLK